MRRKIEIKPIQEKSKRHTTFTKRRQGLFRKVEELCERCDAEAAAFAFSKAGNIFAVGDPHVEDVIARYLEDDSSAMATAERRDDHGRRDGDVQEEQGQQEDAAAAEARGSNSIIGDENEEQSVRGAVAAPPQLTDAGMRIEEALAKGGWEAALRDLTAAETCDLEAEVSRIMNMLTARAAEIEGNNPPPPAE